ncbi:MAG: hypothetical protein EB127_12045 [Alphaproteobacteria bacterium]|nr:hypothetical protein [Alphaproteobacteria bacterium]
MILLDLILIITLSASILYSIILNKRILDIEQYRGSMVKLLKEFDDSVSKSEHSLVQLRSLISDGDFKIKNIQDLTLQTTKELVPLLTKADKLSDELEMIIASGNRLYGRISESLATEKNCDQDGYIDAEEVRGALYEEKKHVPQNNHVNDSTVVINHKRVG